MLSRIPALILAALVVPLSACAPAGEEPEPAVEEAPTTEAEVKAIKSVNKQFLAAVNAGEVDTLPTLCADGVVGMPPNEPAIGGKEAMESWFRTFFDEFTVEETGRSRAAPTHPRSRPGPVGSRCKKMANTSGSWSGKLTGRGNMHGLSGTATTRRRTRVSKRGGGSISAKN
jgi:hypothetical protein